MGISMGLSRRVYIALFAILAELVVIAATGNQGVTNFVNDKDKDTWSISNPDAVKGHEGHHVKIKALLNEGDHSVKVESLSMLSKGKQTGEMQK